MGYSAWNRHASVLRLPGWQIALLLVLALALGIAIVIVAAGVFLIALPVAAVGVLAYRLFGKGRRRPPGSTTVIEGEYEVVEGARPPPGRGRGRR